MIICGLIFIGMVFGAGMAAIYWRGVADESKTLRQALDQANSQTAAANEIIDAQRNVINQQQATIADARQELRSVLKDHWPVQAAQLQQQAATNKAYEGNRP